MCGNTAGASNLTNYQGVDYGWFAFYPRHRPIRNRAFVNCGIPPECFRQIHAENLSGKWLRAAGFDTGQQVTVKVMKGCIVLVAYNEQEQRLQDDYKRTKAKLIEIEDALAAIQAPRPGKRLAKSNTNHLA